MQFFLYFCPMINFLKKQIALFWAKKMVKSETFKFSKAQENQEKILLSLIKNAEKTLFGKIHNFDEIKTISDFQKNVPIYTYENLKPFIDKIKRGENHILLPEKPLYFAKTSGSTAGAKYIPISNEGIKSQINAARQAILYYINNKKNANFINGKMIFLQGSPLLEEINGIKIGRLSGIVDHHIPSYLKKNRLPDFQTNTIEDWEEKINQIVLKTEKENMTLISGIPPWLIMYFEKLIERNHKKIKEIFPNLQLIITGGVNYQPYEKKIQELLGSSVDIVETFPASEGFFAFQDDYQKNDYLLLTHHGIFYEFVPLKEIHTPNPTRLTLKNVNTNEDYALIITTESGLWSYSIGDVIRFTSLNPYRIIVSGRTQHYTSAFGEHIIAHQAEQALKNTTEKHKTRIYEFHLAPQVTPNEGLPYHQWLIEFDTYPTDFEEFSKDLDLEMRKQNIYYDDLITGKVLRRLIISPLKKNSFIEFAKKSGKLGGQNKIPRLSNHREIADFLENYKID